MIEKRKMLRKYIGWGVCNDTNTECYFELAAETIGHVLNILDSSNISMKGFKEIYNNVLVVQVHYPITGTEDLFEILLNNVDGDELFNTMCAYYSKDSDNANYENQLYYGYGIDKFNNHVVEFQCLAKNRQMALLKVKERSIVRFQMIRVYSNSGCTINQLENIDDMGYIHGNFEIKPSNRSLTELYKDFLIHYDKNTSIISSSILIYNKSVFATCNDTVSDDKQTKENMKEKLMSESLSYDSYPDSEEKIQEKKNTGFHSYKVCCGAFSEKENADILIEKLKEKGFNAFIDEKGEKGNDNCR